MNNVAKKQNVLNIRMEWIIMKNRISEKGTQYLARNPKYAENIVFLPQNMLQYMYAQNVLL